MATLIVQQERGYFPTKFRNIDEMCNYHLSLNDSCHYELIVGMQSLYFDIDGGKLSNINLTQIVDRIYSYLSYLGNLKYAILIHSSSDTVKQSYHIVVKGIHFIDHNDCGEYARNICKDIDTFDSKVYSTARNLRMMHSRKRDATRVKQFHSLYNYGYYTNDELHLLYNDKLFAMKASLVTCIDFESVLLSNEKTEASLNARCSVYVNLWNDDRMSIGTKLLEQVFPNVFKAGKMNNNSIHLTRLLPYHCPLCNRVHENDGGNLIVRRVNNEDKYFFTCFRNEEGTRLPLNDEDVNETLETEVIDDTEIEERQDLVIETVNRIKMLCKFV